VWDTQNLCQLAMVQAHKDVVHSVSANNDNLFSCSLDQTLAVVDVQQLKKIKYNPEKAHSWSPKKLKAKTIYTNDKYPIWRCAVADDGIHVVTGSRKINIVTWDGKEAGEGPKVIDQDLDHIKELFVMRGLLCICRQDTPRAKIFDFMSGKELKVAKFKDPVSRIGFCMDAQHAVVCNQAIENKKPKPPIMRLWKFIE